MFTLIRVGFLWCQAVNRGSEDRSQRLQGTERQQDKWKAVWVEMVVSWKAYALPKWKNSYHSLGYWCPQEYSTNVVNRFSGEAKVPSIY